MNRVKLLNIGRLVLIRHGETPKNKEESGGFCYKDNQARERVGILQDRLHILTPEGHKQARIVGRGLKKHFGVPTCLIHSGFVRAKQTTEEILDVYGKKSAGGFPVIENPLVRERNSGYLSNMTDAEAMQNVSWAYDAWRIGDPFTIVPLGGESLASMCEGRLLHFLQQLDNHFSGYSNATIFVVSHGRTMLGLRYLLEGWTHDRINSALAPKSLENPPNCSVTYYEFSRMGDPILKSANWKLK